MKSPYPRGVEPKLAHITVRRATAAANYNVACGLLCVGLIACVVAYPIESQEFLMFGAMLFVPGLAWRYGQQKTLLELKGLRWSDCPLSRRIFFFLSWYESAPDELDYGKESSFGEPPSRYGD